MKLNERNYFSKKAEKEYMSVSQFKAFEDCQAAALAMVKGKYKRPKTTALLVGSYVDSYFEGTLDKFRADNPELFKKDGTLKSEFVQAEEIIKRLEKDRLFMRYMNGEKQVILTGTIEGVPVKCKIDVLHKDKIVDLKIVKDFRPMYKAEQGRLSWYQAWRYDLQGAVYQEIVRQNTGKSLPFYLNAATKEKITDLGIWHIKQELLDFELERFKEKLFLYDGIKKGLIPAERCEKCEYCKMTKKLKAVIESGEELDEFDFEEEQL
jgi:hypothetical protein